MNNLKAELMMPTTTAPIDDYVCNPDLHLRLGEAEVKQYAEAFKALSNPIRLQIIDLISQGSGQICACDIERHFDLTQPTISHHLKVLREAGLIDSEPRGVWVMHRINASMLIALQGLLMLVNNTGRYSPAFFAGLHRNVSMSTQRSLVMSEPITLFDLSAQAAANVQVEIFDPPMCCPTGLCGPTLDQTLLDVNEMILTLKAANIGIERYQMTSHPQAFINNADVMRLVREQQMAALPITIVNGKIIKVGAYPTLHDVQGALNGGAK